MFCKHLTIETEAAFVEDGILLYFSLILKASVSCSFGVLSSCATESIKMESKSILMFSAVLFGRTVLLSAPVIVSLGSFYGEYLSLSLFATLGAIGGLAMISIDFNSYD